mgnify:CR=1 FL=1
MTKGQLITFFFGVVLSLIIIINFANSGGTIVEIGDMLCTPTQKGKMRCIPSTNLTKD